MSEMATTEGSTAGDDASSQEGEDRPVEVTAEAACDEEQEDVSSSSFEVFDLPEDLGVSISAGTGVEDESDDESYDEEEDESSEDGYYDQEDDEEEDSDVLIEPIVESPRTAEALALRLEAKGVLRTAGVAAAFRAVDRSRFVPVRCRECAFDDSPLRAREEECVVHLSAPSIYASALEALDLQPRDSFLNVGSGTGYFSALVAQIVGPHAVHQCLERCPKLAQRCRQSLAEMDPLRHRHIKVHVASVFDLDWSSISLKFDKIYCGAGANSADAKLLARLLKPGGILVGPFEVLEGEEDDDEDEIGDDVQMSAQRSPLLRRFGTAQSLVKATLRFSSKSFKLIKKEIMSVQFTPLNRDDTTTKKQVLRGPCWGRDEVDLFPTAFRRAVAWIAKDTSARLPWHVWETHILSFLSHEDVKGSSPPPLVEAASSSEEQAEDTPSSPCAHCGAVASSRCGRCKRARFCSRDCQRLAWPTHKLKCDAVEETPAPQAPPRPT